MIAANNGNALQQYYNVCTSQQSGHSGTMFDLVANDPQDSYTPSQGG